MAHLKTAHLRVAAFVMIILFVCRLRRWKLAGANRPRRHGCAYRDVAANFDSISDTLTGNPGSESDTAG